MEVSICRYLLGLAAVLALALLPMTANLVHCQSLVYVGESEPAEDKTDQTVGTAHTSTDEFIPTSEWQQIKEGQSIPKGLHVRINLETGLKEAKLMETDDSNSDRLDQNALEEALKNTATSHDEPHSNRQSSDSEGNTAKKSFRSMDEITAEFASRKISISSEQEILADLLVKLRSSSSHILPLLYDIEFYLHSVDNAKYFTDIGGIDFLINLLANTTEAETVASLCLAIGSASHSNPYVADRVNTAGGMSVMLKHLQLFSSDVNEVAVRRVIFALTAVSCASADGLKSFLDGDGLSLFSSITSHSDLSLKVKVKVYTFVADLFANDGCSSRLGDTSSSEGLENSLTDLEALCRQVAALLPQVKPDHLQHMEKLLLFIQAMAENKMCSTVSDDTLTALETVRSLLIRIPEETEFAEELLVIIYSIQNSIAHFWSQHEEL